MESFWENILDTLFTLLKAFVILLAIRTLCLLMDIPFPIPFVDDMILFLLSHVTDQVPGFGI